MDDKYWQQWVREDADFKAENKSDHKLIKLSINELQKSNESIKTNHLPHLQKCAENNARNINSLKRLIWAIGIIVLILILEADKTVRFFEIIKNFLHL